MICSTKGIAVATIAVDIVPAFQAASAIQVTEPTSSAFEQEEQRPAPGEDRHQPAEHADVRRSTESAT